MSAEWAKDGPGVAELTAAQALTAGRLPKGLAA